MAGGYIYLLIDGTNDFEYVGQTRRSVELRFKEHLRETTCIGRAMRAHGADMFVVAILKKCDTNEELDRWEKHFILSRGTKSPNGYNLTDGGNPCTGFAPKSRTGEKNPFFSKRGKTFCKNLLAAIRARTICRALYLQRLWICSVAPVIITLLVNRRRRYSLLELSSIKIFREVTA